uniref:DUF148 domain-containing protein n=1 Tax=Caenorhabditis tropicalis TaxID=1561998 RepID=A0A1I7UXA1_9PELO
MQFNLFHLLILALFAVSFIVPVHSAPYSEAEIESMMELQDKVNEHMSSSNMSPAQKAKIAAMMAQKQAHVEKSFGK